MAPDTHQKPRIAIGSCLVGENVRFNGGHKKPHPFIEALANHVDYISLCPEVGIGMGVPREPIRLVETDEGVTAKDSKTQTKDYTADLQRFAKEKFAQHPAICGYIFVKGSPSCGLHRIPRHAENGNFLKSDGKGIYAAKFEELNPLLPTEEDGRLFDPAIRESFVHRIYLMHNWLSLQAATKGIPSVHALLQFYTNYKYLVMSHSVSIYKDIGRLLADPHALSLQQLSEQLITLMMSALAKPATRKGLTNALQHIQGYLKNVLTATEKATLNQSIQQFHDGVVPLVVPVTLLKNHFIEKPDPYIQNQIFLKPHPETLGLRSHII